MLQQIIDRRLAGKNKSIGNRERFLRRHHSQVRDAVRRAGAYVHAAILAAPGLGAGHGPLQHNIGSQGTQPAS